MEITKASLRQEILKQRHALSEEETTAKSRLIFETLRRGHLLRDASTIMTYLSVDHEVQTRALARYLLEQGKRLIVPKTDTQRRVITACEITSLDDLQPGAYHIPEPKPTKIRPVEPADIELHIVPGLVFDHCGGRIGYGLGFYDVFLKKSDPNAPRVALAFDFQVLPAIPQDVWDEAMNFIITETQCITAKALPNRAMPLKE